MTDQTRPSVVLTKRYAEAVAFASKLHAEQARKTTTIPYISHLLGASSLVLEAGGDEEMAIAALLHDGPEDQGGRKTLRRIHKKFGKRVAHIVEGCSDSLTKDPGEKEDWLLRKKLYIAHLKEADDDTLTVSLADKLHNARAIVSDLKIHGESTWERFTAKKEGTLWYYQSILEIALASNVPQFLQVNLQNAVSDMQGAGN